MRASVTAARLAIHYFRASAGGDRITALRRVKRWSRRPKKIGASLHGRLVGENLEKRAHCLSLRRRLAIECGNSQAAPPDCSDGAELSPILRTHSGVSSARALDVHMAPVGERRGYKARLGRQRRRSRRDAYFQLRSDHRNASSRRSNLAGATLRTPRRVPKLGVGGRREWQQVDRCRRQKRYAYVFHVLNLLYCCSCEARRATPGLLVARSRCRAFGSGWSRAVVVVSNFELFARVMTGWACASSRFQRRVRC
jgi:hypothetical protein